MKKVILLMMVVAFGMATANAQYYVGGSLGFSSNSEKPEGGDKTTKTSFSIAPEFGYSLTEKLDLGISVEFGLTQNPKILSYYNADGAEVKVDEKIKKTSWSVAPYVRYNLVQFGNFSVLGKASIYVSGDVTKNPYLNADNKVETNDTKNFTFGIGVMPVLKYSLSDKFDLLANLNFLSVSFDTTSSKYNDKKTGTETNFSLNGDTNNVANIGGGNVPFTIGFAYKF